jgi:peptidyl-tRNA hydrolase, PTH1 family
VWLVVGLGNPGSQYQANRHNVGFMVVDELLRRGRAAAPRAKFGAELNEAALAGDKALFCKPMEFMNVSGQAVARAAQFWKIPPHETLVVHDELDIPFGRLKLGAGGGHGGHNGLRSIIDELGTEKFSRLRVGIGEPGRGAVDHVLSRFHPDERQRLGTLLDAAADGVETWAREGTAKAANRFNAFELQAKSEDEGAPPAGEVGGPPDKDGVRRTKTGWRKVLQRGDDG